MQHEERFRSCRRNASNDQRSTSMLTHLVHPVSHNGGLKTCYEYLKDWSVGTVVGTRGGVCVKDKL